MEGDECSKERVEGKQGKGGEGGSGGVGECERVQESRVGRKRKDMMSWRSRGLAGRKKGKVARSGKEIGKWEGKG